jgi:hypothetical protein
MDWRDASGLNQLTTQGSGVRGRRASPSSAESMDGPASPAAVVRRPDAAAPAALPNHLQTFPRVVEQGRD